MKTLASTLFVVAACVAVSGAAAQWTVEPVAGGGPDGIPALEANLPWPNSTTVDDERNVYIVVRETGQILQVDSSGVVHVFLQSTLVDKIHGAVTNSVDMAIAPNGDVVVVGYDGEVLIQKKSTGERLKYELSANLVAVEVDAEGRVYVLTDLDFSAWSSRVFRLDPEDGTTTLVAGLRCDTFPCTPQNGEGVPADQAQILGADIVTDTTGNLFIGGGTRVRRVSAVDGTIWTVAGTGPPGFSGDGGPAIAAQLSRVYGLAFDAVGNLHVADAGNHRVRRIEMATGTISTVAGNGQDGYSGDGGAAVDAAVDSPRGLSFDADGNLYMASDMRVRRVRAIDQVIETHAGNGTPVFSGEGHPATAASIRATGGIVVDEEGNLYVADGFNNRVRKIEADSGTVHTIAGNGDDTLGVEDDGLPATEAVTPLPSEIRLDPEGNLYFQTQFSRTRRIDAITGLISTVPTYRGAVFDALGDQYYPWGGRIYRVDADTGEEEWVAGNGDEGYNGEGVPALDAEMDPGGLAFAANGDLYFTQFALVRRISHETGLVESVAGVGYIDPELPLFGAEVNTMPAVGATLLFYPHAAPHPSGDLWVNQWLPSVLARVDAKTGIMTKIAGTGDYSEPAGTDLEKLVPENLVIGRDGEIYFRSGWIIYRLHRSSLPPVAHAGGDIVARCENERGATVTLDGSLSFDPDDEPGMPSEIRHFWWYEDRGTPNQRVIARGATPTVELPIGDLDMALVVRDASGAEGMDRFTVRITDEDDLDGDGFGACVDTCPGTFDPEQTDSDGNGLGDACERCTAESAEDPDADGVCGHADNCPETPNPGQLDRDLDGVGDVCDACPDTAEHFQTAKETCIQVAPVVAECRGISVDSVEDDARDRDERRLAESLRRTARAPASPSNKRRSGRLFLSEIDRWVPEQLDLAVQYRTCSPYVSVDLLLNGVVLGGGTFEPMDPCSSGYSRVQHFVVDDAGAIAALWRPDRGNLLRVVKRGSAYVNEVSVTLSNGDREQIQCIRSSYLTGCRDPGWISLLDQVRQVRLLNKVPIAEIPYGPDAPAETIHLPVPQFPEYQLCVSSTKIGDPARLLGTTVSGDLIEIDEISGHAERIGLTPLVPVDVVVDPTSRTPMAIGTLPLAQRFDLGDGSKIGAAVSLDKDYQTAEYVGGDLMGGYVYRYLDTGPSQLYVYHPFLGWIDPDTGQTTFSGVSLNVGYPRGLSYDTVEDELWGFFSSPYYSTSRGFLREIDLTVGNEISYDGFRAVGVDSLQFGPDGLLYTVSRDDDDDRGMLYYFDRETGELTLVGDTGFVDVNSLALAGPQGAVDCVVFPAEGERRVAINASCGPPTASIAVGEVACDAAGRGTVTLDGTGSSDPNSTPGTDDALTGYDWYENHGSADETFLGSGPQLATTMSIGPHAVTLRVTNRFGEAATTAAVVESACFTSGLMNPATERSRNHTIQRRP